MFFLIRELLSELAHVASPAPPSRGGRACSKAGLLEGGRALSAKLPETSLSAPSETPARLEVMNDAGGINRGGPDSQLNSSHFSPPFFILGFAPPAPRM